jgi:hypothetical protein
MVLKYGMNVGTMKDTLKKGFSIMILLVIMIGLYGNT